MFLSQTVIIREQRLDRTRKRPSSGLIKTDRCEFARSSGPRNSLVICQEMNDWAGLPCRRLITRTYKASEGFLHLREVGNLLLDELQFMSSDAPCLQTGFPFAKGEQTMNLV
jgi:hypothetical protein